MCTLTYIPLQEGQYLLGSNRDESIQRAPATMPQIIEVGGQQLMYPVDPEAKGTWIATSEKGRSSCLLNGAFKPHDHDPPYKKSRGLVMLDSFLFPNLQAFAEAYDLDGIEPFTLVSFYSSKQNAVSELRWDGSQSHIQYYESNSPRIWCSALLYTKEEQATRLGWFNKWSSNNPDPGISDVQHFHKTAGDGKILAEITTPQGYLIRTLSVTTLEVASDHSAMTYEDLQTKTSRSLSLPRL